MVPAARPSFSRATSFRSLSFIHFPSGNHFYPIRPTFPSHEAHLSIQSGPHFHPIRTPHFPSHQLSISLNKSSFHPAGHKPFFSSYQAPLPLPSGPPSHQAHLPIPLNPLPILLNPPLKSPTKLSFLPSPSVPLPPLPSVPGARSNLSRHFYLLGLNYIYLS